MIKNLKNKMMKKSIIWKIWKRSLLQLYDKYYLLIIISFVLFLSGCSDGVNYFYSPDSAQCTIQCKQIIQKNWCGEGYANFGSQCKCVMLDCVKKVTIQEQPENYTDFRISSSSSECYQNGIKVNCSENFDIDEFIKT